MDKAMKTVIVYPVPMESHEVWATFKPFVERFIHSMKNTDPGIEYTLWVVASVGERKDQVDEVGMFKMFEGLPWAGIFYCGNGCDIGSFQHFANTTVEKDVFQVNCVTRMYAWKSGWLRRLVEAREMFGAGLYGTSISREGGKLHCCCRCYAFDSHVFKEYPHKIESRDQGVFFELGAGNIYEWFKESRYNAKVVYWDGVCNISEDPDAHCWRAPNIYRKGDQSNLLVKDKHSVIFDEASPEERARLQRMCFDGHE